MTLGEWLDRKDISQAAFAQMVGVSQSKVSRLVSEDQSPGLRLAFAIERVTDGAVPAVAWPDRRSARFVRRNRRRSHRNAA